MTEQGQKAPKQAAQVGKEAPRPGEGPKLAHFLTALRAITAFEPQDVPAGSRRVSE